MIATPHVHPAHVTDLTLIGERVRELADHLRRERVDLSVRPGGELSHAMVGRLSQGELELIAHGPPGRRRLLLETPFDGADGPFVRAADELRDRGYGLVIAHPERARATAETASALDRELRLGSVPQLTAAALTGGYGPGARAVALALLRAAPRAVIASDAHGRRAGRWPGLTPALEELRRVGERDPEHLAGQTPRALLARGLSPRAAARAA